jgi:hypothetical protein
VAVRGWRWFLNEWNRSSIEGVRADWVAVWLGDSVAGGSGWVAVWLAVCFCFCCCLDLLFGLLRLLSI